MLPPAGDVKSLSAREGLWPSWPFTTRSPAAATRSRPRLNNIPGPGRSRGSARTALAVASGLSLAVQASAEQSLPYIPTTILVPPERNDESSSVAYIFTPNADDPNSVDFLSLNLSSTLRASSLAPEKLASPLPFLFRDADHDSYPAFAPSVFQNGTIAVVAGDCLAGSTPSLWTYTPGLSSPQWIRQSITIPEDGDPSAAQTTPYHLGNALAFSAQLSPTISPPTIYLYGGMCPNTTTSSSSSTPDWDDSGATALYSNTMLRLSPPSFSSSSYTLSPATSPSSPRPIPAAGFTLTGLPPSLSNYTSSSSGTTGTGTGIMQQQTTHVLLGGHTSRPGAFVNMSTAAVWSLPEETWTFLSIASPSSGRQVVVDSRSGHTTVLSEDGGSLVVYGGWVGDVRTPAEPQLAVVRMGVGLEGWRWEVPKPKEGGEAEDGTGVFGHGAALLPGNVMMVVGGWEIGDGGSGGGGGGGGDDGLRRRQVVGGGARRRTFFNITSLEWVDEYKPPSQAGRGDGGDGAGFVPPSEEENGGSDNSARNRKIGLGVGLGVGLLILLVLAALAIRFLRRRRRRRAARDKTLRDLVQGVNGPLPRGLGENDEMLERDHGIFPWTASAAREWYTGGGDPYTQGRRSLGYETLRGGARSGPSLYIPPPSARPRAARGLYQPSSGISSGNSYDFTPLGRTPTRIEPIYEAEEEDDEDAAKECPLSPDRDEREDDDPFRTPTALSSSPHKQLEPEPRSRPVPITGSRPRRWARRRAGTGPRRPGLGIRRRRGHRRSARRAHPLAAPKIQSFHFCSSHPAPAAPSQIDRIPLRLGPRVHQISRRQKTQAAPEHSSSSSSSSSNNDNNNDNTNDSSSGSGLGLGAHRQQPLGAQPLQLCAQQRLGRNQ
ncbi:hypothetical protein VTK26DRAFT_2875 [Humicola hyalothermophila]